MLSPKYLEDMPESMVRLYAQAEEDILADMARRIAAYDYFIPAAEHQLRMLQEMGAAQDDVFRRLAGLTGKSEHELVRLFEEAGEKACGSDAAIYRRAGLEPPSLNASQALQDRLNAGLQQTGQAFANLTRSTARGVSGELGQALDRAWMQVATGGMDANTAIRSAVKWLAARGVETVDYDSGRKNTLEAAVRRAVVTGVNQTALKMQDALANEMGCDLVEVTAHSGARPAHAAWQGKIYSRSGRSGKYPDFVRSTGYGSGDGLGGWNCRHSFFPYFEGSPRTHTARELAKLDDKTVEYNGRKLTEYQASQEQRHIERQIRRWKRERAAMQAAGQDTYESSAKIQQWQDRQRNFVRQTGLKRQYDREQVAGFGKKEAAAVRKDLAKYEKYRYNKAGTIVVTDDWTEEDHPHLPTTYRPFAVIDTRSSQGKQRDRTVYDETGRMVLQIHGGDHGKPKQHPYGEHGEHIHIYVWQQGEKRPKRTVRNANAEEKIIYKDILGGDKD